MADNNSDAGKGRRSFLARIAMGAGLAAGYGTGALYAFRFLVPGKEKAEYRRLLVTSLADLPPGASKEFKDLTGRKIILVNSDKGLKALSTTCTHLGCQTYWEPKNTRFFCPCHEAVFDVEGKVVSGPPPRPLDTFDVEVDVNNNVYVLIKEV